MIKSILPIPLKAVILHDAIQRDAMTARRAALLEILWNERYLTRSQLIARVELGLGRGCFRSSAWQDTFYRDMRIVKHAFEAVGIACYTAETSSSPAIICRGNRHCPPSSNRYCKPARLKWTSAKSIFTASDPLQNAFTRDAPSATQPAQWSRTDFAKKIRNCHSCTMERQISKSDNIVVLGIQFSTQQRIVFSSS